MPYFLTPSSVSTFARRGFVIILFCPSRIEEMNLASVTRLGYCRCCFYHRFRVESLKRLIGGRRSICLRLHISRRGGRCRCPGIPSQSCKILIKTRRSEGDVRRTQSLLFSSFGVDRSVFRKAQPLPVVKLRAGVRLSLLIFNLILCLCQDWRRKHLSPNSVLGGLMFSQNLSVG